MTDPARRKRSKLILLPVAAEDDPRTVQRQVYDHLRWHLLSGHLEPGDGISLRNTATALGTSPTPVREALRRLESEGGLVVGANRVLTVPLISAVDLREIRIARVALEGMATRLAAEQMTRQEVDAVTQVYSEMDAAAEKRDVDAYLERNWLFHSTIYHATHNRLLTNMIEDLWLRVGPLIRLAIPSPGHFTQSMHFHWAATQALIQGDAEAAARAIESDISEAADDLLRVLEAHGNEERGIL